MGSPVTATTTPTAATAIIPAAATAPIPSIIPSRFARELAFSIQAEHVATLGKIQQRTGEKASTCTPQGEGLSRQYSFATTYFERFGMGGSLNKLARCVEQILAFPTPTSQAAVKASQEAIDKVVVGEEVEKHKGFHVKSVSLNATELTFMRNNLHTALQGCILRMEGVRDRVTFYLAETDSTGHLPKPIVAIINAYADEDWRSACTSTAVIARTQALFSLSTQQAIEAAQTKDKVIVAAEDQEEVESLAEAHCQQVCLHALFFGATTVVSVEDYMKSNDPNKKNWIPVQPIMQIASAQVAIKEVAKQKKANAAKQATVSAM